MLLLTSFHLSCLCWFIYVWQWHIYDPAALLLKGATGFGWFFRYLTFCGFTVQTIMLMVAILDDIRCLILPTRYQKKGCAKRAIIAWLADDIACISFAFANVVSIMFYSIYFATGGRGVMDPNENRPNWLSPSMHILNSIIAWADLGLIFVVGGYQQGRTFSSLSFFTCLSLALLYTWWSFIVKAVHGVWPYPFLNKLPHPQGIIGTAFVAVLVFASSFSLGSRATNMATNLVPKNKNRRGPKQH